MNFINEFDVDTVTKNDGITVRVWCNACSVRPFSGHYNFKFLWEECQTRDKAKILALELLQQINLDLLPPGSMTNFLDSKGKVI